MFVPSTFSIHIFEKYLKSTHLSKFIIFSCNFFLKIGKIKKVRKGVKQAEYKKIKFKILK